MAKEPASVASAEQQPISSPVRSDTEPRLDLQAVVEAFERALPGVEAPLVADAWHALMAIHSVTTLLDLRMTASRFLHCAEAPIELLRVIKQRDLNPVASELLQPAIADLLDFGGLKPDRAKGALSLLANALAIVHADEARRRRATTADPG